MRNPPRTIVLVRWKWAPECHNGLGYIRGNRKITFAHRVYGNGVKWGGAERSAERKYVDPVRVTRHPSPHREKRAGSGF